MTHSELIDAYDQAKRSHEAAAVGARVEAFVRLLVAERALAAQLGLGFCQHLSHYRERWSP